MRGQLARVEERHILAAVLRLGMVRAMPLNRERPVVHRGGDMHTSEARTRRPAPCPGEEVHRDHFDTGIATRPGALLFPS